MFFNVKAIQKHEKKKKQQLIWGIFYLLKLNFQAFDIVIKAYRIIFSWKEKALKASLNDSFSTVCR